MNVKRKTSKFSNSHGTIFCLPIVKVSAFNARRLDWREKRSHKRHLEKAFWSQEKLSQVLKVKKMYHSKLPFQQPFFDFDLSKFIIKESWI